MVFVNEELPDFKYYYLAGPVPISDLNNSFTQGNCRLAMQLWFHIRASKSFEPQEMLNPNCYKEVGEIVLSDVNSLNWSKILNVGDIIFSERIKDKNFNQIDKGPSTFDNENDYIISLHSAVVHSKEPFLVWHATAVSGNTCFWDENTFLNYYKPVRVRRVF